jgi:hypothetical protein
MNVQPPQTFADAVVRPFADFLIRNRWRALTVLLFTVLFKLPDYASRMIDPCCWTSVSDSRLRSGHWVSVLPNHSGSARRRADRRSLG